MIRQWSWRIYTALTVRKATEVGHGKGIVFPQIQKRMTGPSNPLDSPAPRIPAPAHPRKRHEPLPSHLPKAADDDAQAPQRIAAILASPSYRQADQDVEFLNRDDTRGLRLQLDYLKTEFLLEEHAVKQTVVVFGSTRVPEPAAAQRQVDMLRVELAGRPTDEALRRRLRAAMRILEKSHYYDVCREFGRLVGRHGNDAINGPLVLMTGGGPGLMEAAHRGTFDIAAKSVGLNIKLPHEQYPNPYITPELCVRFHYFALRKLHFMLRAKALVAFPGGYGTFDELFQALTLVQTRSIKPIPIVLVGRSYWQQAFDADFLVDEGVIEPEDRELFWYAETAHDIWAGILAWYRSTGEPLLRE